MTAIGLLNLRLKVVVSVVLVTCCGCQETQVQQKSNALIATVPTLYEQETLDNLVRTSVNDRSIPFFATPTQGTNQQTRQLQLGSTTGFSLVASASAQVADLLGHFLLSSEQAAVTPQIANQQSFQLAPLIDPNKISLMNIALREALGYPVTNLDAFRLGKFYSDQSTVFAPDFYRAINGQNLPTKDVFDAGIKKGNQPGENVPEETYPLDPRPWVHVENDKRCVPKDACVVSQCCGKWMWVGPLDMPGFSQFTLALLDIASAIPSTSGTTKIEVSLANPIEATFDGHEKLELKNKAQKIEPPSSAEQWPPTPGVTPTPYPAYLKSPTIQQTVPQIPYASPPP